MTRLFILADWRPPFVSSGVAEFELLRHYQSGYRSQMKLASVTETKNELRAILEQVKEGETVLITEHGKPIARLECISAIAWREREGLDSRAALAPQAPLTTDSSDPR